LKQISRLFDVITQSAMVHGFSFKLILNVT